MFRIKFILCISCIFINFIVKGENLFQLNVIHLNDIHARFDETSPISTRCIDNNCIGGIARLYTAIRRIQQQQPNSIVLNAGDSFQGTLWYNLYKWNVTQHFLNKLPCDAYTLGNHEFDDFVSGVVPFLKHLNCSVVVANMDVSEEPSMQGLFKNSTILIKNGTKIGIIGILTSVTSNISNPERIKFTDEIQAVKNEAETLKKQNCSIIIVLSHCGVEFDKRIAQEGGPHISLIVGGHSHTFLYSGEKLPGPDKPKGPYPILISNKYRKTVLIVQASFNTKYLGNITLWYDKAGNIKKYEGAPIYLDHNIPKDPVINKEIEEWKKEIDKYGNTLLGTSHVILDRNTRRSGECNLGSFLADAMVNYYINKSDNNSWTYASIAIINSGALRSSIYPGNVTLYDLINCHPFENTIDVVILSGKVIKDILEYSVTPSVVRNGLLHEFVQVSGIRVKYDLSKPVGSRVNKLLLLCNHCLVPTYSPVNYTQLYRVILPSYLVFGGDGFSMILQYTNSRIMGPNAIDVFSEFVSKRSPITYGSDERIILEGTSKLSNRSAVIQIPVILYIIVYTLSIIIC